MFQTTYKCCPNQVLMCRSFPYDPMYSVFVSFQVDILVNNGARGQLGLISKTSLEVDLSLIHI